MHHTGGQAEAYKTQETWLCRLPFAVSSFVTTDTFASGLFALNVILSFSKSHQPSSSGRVIHFSMKDRTVAANFLLSLFSLSSSRSISSIISILSFAHCSCFATNSLSSVLIADSSSSNKLNSRSFFSAIVSFSSCLALQTTYRVFSPPETLLTLFLSSQPSKHRSRSSSFSPSTLPDFRTNPLTPLL